MVSYSEGVSECFRERAEKVFASFNDPYDVAVQDAKMMWLAWRGDDRFVQVHLSDRAGSGSSWRFCQYEEIPGLTELHRYLEARPLQHAFSDHVVASLVVLMQHEVEDGSGVRVYAVPVDAEKPTEEVMPGVSDAYAKVKEGFEVIADWHQRPGEPLKTKSISIRSDRFVFADFPRLASRTSSGAKGWARVLADHDKADSRRRRKSPLGWVLSR